MAADLKALAEQLVNLTVKEVKELADILKEEYGIEPAAAGAVVVAGGGAEAAEAEAKEEKTAFDVILQEIGPKKLQVIKEVRAITGLGLKDAKELVEKAPSTIKEGIPKAEAEEIKSKLEELGAKVEIK